MKTQNSLLIFNWVLQPIFFEIISKFPGFERKYDKQKDTS